MTIIPIQDNANRNKLSVVVFDALGEAAIDIQHCAHTIKGALEHVRKFAGSVALSTASIYTRKYNRSTRSYSTELVIALTPEQTAKIVNAEKSNEL
jgi:hypothetical protein